MLAAAEGLGGAETGDLTKADGVEGLVEGGGAEFGVAEAEFGEDVVAAEVAFGELKDESGELLEVQTGQELVAPKDLASVGFGESGEDFEEGGFAGAALADDQAELLGGEIEVDVGEDGLSGGSGVVGQVTEIKHLWWGEDPALNNRRACIARPTQDVMSHIPSLIRSMGGDGLFEL